MTARHLAEELEVHIRTVYRCIDALCASGVPIAAETGRKGGYYLPAHVKLEPLLMRRHWEERLRRIREATEVRT
ncbi:MAG: hypothetical protein A9Z00_09275 [Thermobacillus sp. ZCTH02-B1]|nr:MAG: hypothetical protein A9Z00_09275 [Thermobacillus sp. ZCTH02-B1]